MNYKFCSQGEFQERGEGLTAEQHPQQRCTNEHRSHAQAMRISESSIPALHVSCHLLQQYQSICLSLAAL